MHLEPDTTFTNQYDIIMILVHQCNILLFFSLGGKLLVAPVVGGLALAGGAALLGVSVLALPIYAGYKIHKQIEMEKRRKRRRQAAREWRAKVEAIRKKG